MKKISIVGVDGSGKTVLMTALGNKYERPDEVGLFLSPETSNAFNYIKLQMDKMQRGEWPANTVAGQSSVLKWGLYHRHGMKRTFLCDLSFLDFAGEVYRLAFGSKDDHDAATYADQEIAGAIEELKEHLRSSDTLIVLVNLKDIIGGTISSARTRESLWLYKAILDYATDNLKIRHTAVVFTQTDAYRSTIEVCSGVRGAYEQYLPHVASKYPDMPILAVSAVNKTKPDDNGNPCPAEGFGSEGLNSLMEWIVSTVPGCENLVSDIKAAPSRYKARIETLFASYIQALTENRLKREQILESVRSTLHDMENAIQAYPLIPQDNQAFRQLKADEKALRALEKTYTALSGNVPSMKDEEIHQAMDDLCLANSYAQKNRTQIAIALQLIKNEWRKREARKKRIIYICAALALLFIASGGVSWWLHKLANRKQEKDSQAKIARGWSYRQEGSRRIAEWMPGAYHSQTQDLKAANEPDTWISIKPGYVWKKEMELEWKPGIAHLQNKDLQSGRKPDTWIATKPGYVWKGGTNMAWKPGASHPQNDDLQADLKKDTWFSTKAGYVWKKGIDIEWTPGTLHPQNENLKAGKKQDTWESTKPGYVWDGDANIKWVPDTPHPQTKDLRSGKKPDTWESTRPGYIWDGDANIKWAPNVYYPQKEYLMAARKQDEWVATKPGYVWTGGTEIAWKPKLTHNQYPQWEASEIKGYWRLKDGYKPRNTRLKYPKNTGVPERNITNFGAQWVPSWVSHDGSKRATTVPGVYEFAHPCSSCNGTGRKYSKLARKNLTCEDCEKTPGIIWKLTP